MSFVTAHTFSPGDSPLQGNDSLIIGAVLRSNYVGTKNCSPQETSFPRKRESPDSRRKIFYCTGLMLFILLFGCGNKKQEKKFFDVPGYFKGEIEFIKNNLSTVSKISVYNDDTTYQQYKAIDINWEKEFAIFLECDINKPVYYANMRIDHPPVDSVFYNTTYTSMSKKTGIQKLVVDSSFGKPDMISVELVKTNLISSTEITAIYFPLHHYFIYGNQTIKNLGQKNVFWVQGQFKFK